MMEHGKFLVPEYLFPNSQVFFLRINLDGVALFFVLSGFLIGQIILKTFHTTGDHFKTLTNFWIRRWMRTLPNYFLVLCVLLLWVSITGPSSELEGTWQYFFFLQNISTPHPGFFGEAWSLSIEEWFYLLLPLLIIAGRLIFKLSLKKAVLLSALFFIVFPIAVRCYRFYTVEIPNLYTWDLVIRKQVITRMDSLMAGVLAAYCYVYYENKFLSRKVFFFIAGLLILAINRMIDFMHIGEWGMYRTVWSLSVNALATLFLLPMLVSIKTGRGWLFRAITWTSILSYSMYLLNLGIVQFRLIAYIDPETMSHVKTMYLLKYALYWLLTFILSYFLYTYFERPVTNLREKLQWKKMSPGKQ